MSYDGWMDGWMDASDGRSVHATTRALQGEAAKQLHVERITLIKVTCKSPHVWLWFPT